MLPSFPLPIPSLASAPPTHPRTAILISSDASFRSRLGQRLGGLRWKVREAASGAQAWAEAGASAPEAVIVDAWLPDLELAEFLREFRAAFPRVDIIASDGTATRGLPAQPVSPGTPVRTAHEPGYGYCRLEYGLRSRMTRGRAR